MINDDGAVSDDSYDYHICTNDVDDDEILTVKSDNSVKIIPGDKWSNNSVLIL